MKTRHKASTDVVADDPLLDTSNAARYLGDMAAGTLIRWRAERINLSYIRLANGSIRYQKSELDRFIQANVVKIPAPSPTQVPQKTV